MDQGSLKRGGDGLTVSFNVTDTAKVIPVTAPGILPDLFKEGKGVVAQGRLGPDGTFKAHEVLAKHDENYMPPEAAHAVEQAHKAQKDREVAVVAALASPELLMIPEIGHFALILALLIATVQAVLPIAGAARGNRVWMSVARPARVGKRSS